MTLYLVDFSDGQIETRDSVGTDMPNPEAARGEVMRMLVDTARFRAAHGNEQRLVATVRDGADRELYRVVLALTCSRPGQEAREGAATQGHGKYGEAAKAVRRLREVGTGSRQRAADRNGCDDLKCNHVSGIALCLVCYGTRLSLMFAEITKISLVSRNALAFPRCSPKLLWQINRPIPGATPMEHNPQPAGPNGASFPEAIGPPFLPPSRARAAVQVLLVEDDELVRECLSEMLGDAGWRVGRAADAKEALDRMALFGAPGVLVTDLALGCGMSGLALIAAVRLRWPGVPAVLISGADAAEPALDPGDCFLRKPFKLDDLLQVVSGLMAEPGVGAPVPAVL